jgi:hypothetical protein
MHVETTYSNYQDFGGLKAPGKISQKQVGMETFVVATSGARANPPDLVQLMTPPAPGRGGAPAAAASRGGGRPTRATSRGI